MSETLDELLTRVRDYDEHTSDADIDRLCAEIERLQSERDEARKAARWLRSYFSAMREMSRSTGFQCNARDVDIYSLLTSQVEKLRVYGRGSTSEDELIALYPWLEEE